MNAVRGQLAVVVGMLALGGCSGIQRDPPIQVWPDMKLQKKFKPQRSTDLFPDMRESRRPPEGAVARGHMSVENPFDTGMDGKLYVGKSPVKVTEAVLGASTPTAHPATTKPVWGRAWCPSAGRPGSRKT
jgi:hypothetical protein